MDIPSTAAVEDSIGLIIKQGNCWCHFHQHYEVYIYGKVQPPKLQIHFKQQSTGTNFFVKESSNLIIHVLGFETSTQDN
jgi:hypothetical protein